MRPTILVLAGNPLLYEDALFLGGIIASFPNIIVY